MSVRSEGVYEKKYGNIIDDCVNLYNTYCHPILFSEIKRPPIWPVIVTAIIIFIAISEIGSQSCSGGVCNHYKNVDQKLQEKINNGSATLSDYIDMTIDHIKLNHTVVGWRRALLLSMILSLLILSGYNYGLPDGFDFFLVSFILFVAIYSVSLLAQWYWWLPQDTGQEEELYHLRNQIKDTYLDQTDNQTTDDYSCDSYDPPLTDLLSDSYDYVNSMINFTK